MIAGNPSSRHEGMSTQRCEEKSAPMSMSARASEPFGSYFYVFFPPPGLALCKLGLVKSVVLPEVLIPVLGPSFVLFLRAFPFLNF